MPVQPPLRSWIDQAIQRESLQNQIPTRAFATGRQQFAPESIEPELTPQIASKPASAPLTGLAQRHLVEPHAYNWQRMCVRIFHRSMVVGEERDLLRRVVILAEQLDGFAS